MSWAQRRGTRARRWLTRGAVTNSNGVKFVADISDANGPTLQFTVPRPTRSRFRHVVQFCFGSLTPASLAMRLGLDTMLITLSIAAAVALVGDLRAGIAIVLTGAVLAPIVLVTSGTYGFLGTPKRSSQMLHLSTAVLFGAAVEGGILSLTTASQRTVIATIISWIAGGVLAASLRMAKGLFEDRFTVMPRSVKRLERPVRHVLLIGGAGYIGSILGRQLLDRGYHVSVLDKLIFGDIGVRDLKAHPRFRLIEADFRDVEALVGAARGADAVVHLGAIVGDPACAVDPERAIDVNYRATRLIRNVCRGLGVRRLIFASTCSVYGVRDPLSSEESELNPVSVYAASKIASERALLEESQAELASTVLRLATVYGWSHRPRFDLVVNLLTAKAALEGEVDIINGHQWRPFISVKDVARAFVACLEAHVDDVRNQVFNVGDDTQNLRLHDLQQVFIDKFPGLKVNEVENDSDQRSYHVSFERIRSVLGFQTLTTVDEGVEELLRMIVESGITDYGDPRFSNVKFVRERPDLVFGPDEASADPQIPLLRSMYDPTESQVAAR